MVLWIAAAVAAYFVKGLCGFANTLVLTSILSFGAVNADISPIDLLLGYPSNLILVWKNRKSLDRKIWLPLTVLVLAGSIPGALLLKNADAGKIKIFFGIVVAALGLEMLFRGSGKIGEKAPDFHSSRWMMWGIGLLSGVLCGLFGVGALLAAYVSRNTEDSRSFKANISAVFVAENTFRLILYSLLRLITVSEIQAVLMLIPFALLGLFLGMKSGEKLKESSAKKAVSVLLVLSGISLIIKNL